MTVIKQDRARNRSNLKRIKKEVIRIATGNPADFHNIDLDEEDNDFEDETDEKPSLLDSIRSSDTVQSISFMKRMNPFVAWNKSKFRYDKRQTNEMNEKVKLKEDNSQDSQIGKFGVF